jgi:Sulfatase
MNRHPVLHPYLFAVFPILFLLSHSLGTLSPSQACRPIIIVLLFTSLLLLLFKVIFKGWYRAGFITSVIVLMLFNYGYSYRLPQDIHLFGLSISRHLLILCVWGILISVFVSNWLWKRVRGQIITDYLNITSLLMLLYAIYFLLTFWISSKQDPLRNWSRPENLSEDNTQLSVTYQPDIFYIILDGYARADVLSEIYKYDNSNFVDELKARGFYVANDSHSNYDETQLSLASSMNFEYLDYLSFAAGIRDNQSPLGTLIINSRVRKWLENTGYKIYLSGEYLFSEVDDPAIVFYSQRTHRLSTFESLLLESTMFEILVEETNLDISTYTYQTHREKILDGFSEIHTLAQIGGPKFVFVHIIAPHPPFVFDENGVSIQPDREYTIFDTGKFTGGRENYIDGYRDQLTYINQLTIDAIDQIIQNSMSQPIIILQADHGPAALMGDSLETSCVKERLSILNAYYVPEEKTGFLYPSITPVNTFRMIFNNYFGTRLDILQDKALYSWGHRYSFTDVTNQVNNICTTEGNP